MITAEKVLNDEACQEHVFKNEWCVSKRSALKAMGEYLRLKVAESESKNLKQAHVSSNEAQLKENKKESEVALLLYDCKNCGGKIINGDIETKWCNCKIE